MKRLIWILYFSIFIQAMSSWGQDGSVLRDGKEWLQPKDFVNYSYDQTSAVCPDGICSGTLPGSTFDLTGYTWASIDDMEALFNTYGNVGDAILEDFAYITTDKSTRALEAMVRNPPPEEGKLYVALILSNEPYDPDFDFVESAYETARETSEAGVNSGVWFWRSVATDFKVHLEEPIDSETHSGIGNLRGWAIADDGIDRVEIYIDGKYKYDAPYGGSRADVGKKYPDVPYSDDSGFSLAFGYSNLGVGEHTAIARAFNTLGEYTESTATFNVVEFDKKFIPKTDVVDTAQAEVTLGGDEILLDNVSIGERLYELRLKWRTQEQGFEIIEIR